MRQVLRLFLQAVPDRFDVTRIREELKGIHGLLDVHDLHVWSLDGEQHVMSMHAVVQGNPEVAKLAELKSQIRHMVKKHGHVHVTVELEHADEHCPNLNCV